MWRCALAVWLRGVDAITMGALSNVRIVYETHNLSGRVSPGEQAVAADLSILGSGWLGLPLAREMAARGHAVRLSTTRVDRLKELQGPGIRPFVVDITQPGGELRAFLESEVLIVNITSKDLTGFGALVEALGESSVRHVLFISSTSVYPDCNAELHEDEGRENPDHPLYRIERLFQTAQGFDTTILRFGGLVGYTRHPGRFFASGRAVPNPGGYVNLIHRDDCINIISRIVERAVWGEVFNACADEHPVRIDFYRFCAGLAGLPAPAAGEGERFKIISNKRLKKRLEYDFVYPDPMRFDYD
jgi:nucleoside-diphosphate-sugar epimerase